MRTGPEAKMSPVEDSWCQRRRTRPDPCDELARREGFGHIVVGAQLQADDPIDLGAPARHHDHRDVGYPAQPLEDLGPRKPGQSQIEQDQLRAGAAEGLQGGFTRPRRQGLKALVSQQTRQELDDRFIVLDDHHARHGEDTTNGMESLPEERGQILPRSTTTYPVAVLVQ
jgi:hypothetical protein